MGLRIAYVETAQAAREHADAGWEPIECAFGAESILGRLAMDHHGAESWREGVALRAYRDHYAARAQDPRFVVTGAADADACLSIASLVGVVPHPSHRDERLATDLIPLAELVNRIDTDPIGVALEDDPYGPLLLLWNQLGSGIRDALAFYGGVERWRALLRRRAPHLLIAAAHRVRERRAAAREAELLPISAHVAFVESPLWGFDVWYETRPIVVVYNAAQGAVSVGCPNAVEAARRFGTGGLLAVFPYLQPSGWGGHEAFGGGPRGRRLTREEALVAAAEVARRARDSREAEA